MRFKDIIGNDNVVKALVGMADSGRVPHALMMYENDGGGALAIALAFISYLNCKDRHDGDSCGECASCNQTDKLIFPDLRFTFPI
ncbi:MAG: DNA polymerase III subunit delta, partial [Bacteroidales bacterium]|nr:DNA polymerase III subunit delta [Bacteroidales bacterium]